MLRKELLEAVKHLEIVARRAVDDSLAGQYESVFKGRGMDFTGVREYQPGDDVRVIDWNVSARMNELHVKQFIEERELTVFLMVDVSGSQTFGTQKRRKQETAAELAALVAFAAVENNDRVGLMMFSDEIETLIPPQKGRKHVLRVISEILDFEPERRGTDIPNALERLAQVADSRSVVFLVSDFLDPDFEDSLNLVHQRHEIIPLVLSDPLERELPEMGMVFYEDPETGEVVEADTTSPDVRERYKEIQKQKREQREEIFRKHGIQSLEISTAEDHIEPLIAYFQRRAERT
jgi:uncharacterized protein (DUF58 family)